MATYLHTVVTVSGSNPEAVDAARTVAVAVGLEPTALQPGRNGFASFAVLPDGNAGDRHRSAADRETRIASLLQALRPIRVDWVAVRFGAEGGAPEILDSSSSVHTVDARRGNRGN